MKCMKSTLSRDSWSTCSRQSLMNPAEPNYCSQLLVTSAAICMRPTDAHEKSVRCTVQLIVHIFHFTASKQVVLLICCFILSIAFALPERCSWKQTQYNFLSECIQIIWDYARQFARISLAPLPRENIMARRVNQSWIGFGFTRINGFIKMTTCHDY